MTQTSTTSIVEALTRSIVEHHLHPGTKLVEQKLADHFGVSRTLVRQALFQLSQKHLVRLHPSRGAYVATPSPEEARQVFSVRRMVEVEMIREFVRKATNAQIKDLSNHLSDEKRALLRNDVAERTHLLGDFHVQMAVLMGNQVLAQLLEELISRCALINLLYQSRLAAEHSVQEHSKILKAIVARDEKAAVRLMTTHLQNVEKNLALDGVLHAKGIALALA